MKVTAWLTTDQYTTTIDLDVPGLNISSMDSEMSIPTILIELFNHPKYPGMFVQVETIGIRVGSSFICDITLKLEE
ncbi:hypothetical protein [Sporosarcina sp. FSL K6-5500]|uniref:hypothetical protein n=1 Tax=Sporosarcina sp. FSL K6-5500 TaxID=2921558 RepID=UPI0030FCC0C8